MDRRFGGASLAVLAIVVLTACAEASVADPSSTIQPLRSVEQYRGFGLTLSPPPTGATTRLTTARIVALCNGDATCPPDRSGVTFALSSATDTNGTVDETTERTTRTIDHRLVVAMTFADAMCTADSPPGVGAYTAAPVTGSSHGCLWITLVDAGTGGFLLSVSGGMPQDT